MRKTMSVRIGIVAAAMAAAVALVGCGSPASAGAPAPQSGNAASAMPTTQEVQAFFAEWNDALETGDPQKVADRYASDAVLLPTLSDNVRSDRAEIVDYFVKFLKDKPQGQILESHVKILGPDSAVDAGTYRFTFAATGATAEARYSYVYERVNGEWKIVNHHSSAMPGRP